LSEDREKERKKESGVFEHIVCGADCRVKDGMLRGGISLVVTGIRRMWKEYNTQRCSFRMEMIKGFSQSLFPSSSLKLF